MNQQRLITDSVSYLFITFSHKSPACRCGMSEQGLSVIPQKFQPVVALLERALQSHRAWLFTSHFLCLLDPAPLINGRSGSLGSSRRKSLLARSPWQQVGRVGRFQPSSRGLASLQSLFRWEAPVQMVLEPNHPCSLFPGLFPGTGTTIPPAETSQCLFSVCSVCSERPQCRPGSMTLLLKNPMSQCWEHLGR